MIRFWTITPAMLCLFMLTTVAPIRSQSYTVLHTFTGPDGADPTAGVTMDQAGNLYGTANVGGHTGGRCISGCGTVYKLTYKNSTWIFTSIYTFNYSDGSQPAGRVLFGPDGKLYGTTTYGGAFGYGVVFSLQPRATNCPTSNCQWIETVLYSFTGGVDGGNPWYGDLAFDRAGNIYGTTAYGGTQNVGALFKLSSSHGVWTETVLHSFGATPDDATYPYSGVTLDSSGNIYGTTGGGGTGGVGTIYELQSGGGWTILHNFLDGDDDGEHALGGLIFDRAGNLYGASSEGGTNGGGVAYELTPAGGTWSFHPLYSLHAYQGTLASLATDSSGQLYGTLYFGGSQEVFRLTPSSGGWTLTGFSGGVGSYAAGNVTLDAAGNLYTTSGNFNGSDGAVFEITP